MISIDLAIWITGLIAEIGLCIPLVRWRTDRRLRMFFAYLLWCIFSDIFFFSYQHFHPEHYLIAYLIEMPVDSILQLAVLVDLALSLLRPFRSSLPGTGKTAIAGIASLTLLLAVITVWPLESTSAFHAYTYPWSFLMTMQRTFAVLRILIFLALATFSQLLAIGWRDRELQIATGFGFYSLVSLAGSVMHGDAQLVAYTHHIDQITAISYIAALLYWFICFLQPERPRLNFNSGMRNSLLHVADTAHDQRASVESRSVREFGDR